MTHGRHLRADFWDAPAQEVADHGLWDHRPLCLLLIGAWVLVPRLIDPFASNRCKLISAEPAADTVLPYARLQNDIPFSTTVQFRWEKTQRPSFTRLMVEGVEGRTGNGLASVGFSDELKCFGICQISTQGVLQPEVMYQDKITLAVSTSFVDADSGLAVGGCPRMFIQYPVSGNP